MNKRRQNTDTFLDFLNTEGVKASKDTQEKSLLAFQDGLKQAEFQKPTRKRKKIRQRVIGISSTAVVAGIAGVLVLSTGDIGNNSDGTLDSGNGGDAVQQHEGNSIGVESEERNELIETVWNRPAIEINDLNSTPISTIFNDQLIVQLPGDWNINERAEDGAYSIHMSGTNGEEMNLVLFKEDYNQEVFDAHLQDLTDDFAEAEKVSIPVDEFINKIEQNNRVPFPYENVFPFETESAKMTAFIDEANGQFLEVYVSKLFGHPMIFTSELSLDNIESRTIPIQFLTFMRTNYPHTIHGSKGELHPEFNRPIEKNVLLQVGATGVEEVDMELYEIEELNMTSYLPSGTEVERIEHGDFIEWRFTEPNVSKNSFYSFGKLKDGFPLENSKEIMFEEFDIDLAYFEETGGPTPHHYSYQTSMNEEFFDGYIELFEANGEWYYEHKHADRHDYNGGVYIQRLRYFIESIEWH